MKDLDAGDLVVTYPCGCLVAWYGAEVDGDGRRKLYKRAARHGWSVLVARGGEPFPAVGCSDPICGHQKLRAAEGR